MVLLQVHVVRFSDQLRCSASMSGRAKAKVVSYFVSVTQLYYVNKSHDVCVYNLCPLFT